MFTNGRSLVVGFSPTLEGVNGEGVVARLNGEAGVARLNEEEGVARLNGEERVARLNREEVVARLNGEEVVARLNGEEGVARLNGEEGVARLVCPVDGLTFSQKELFHSHLHSFHIDMGRSLERCIADMHPPT